MTTLGSGVEVNPVPLLLSSMLEKFGAPTAPALPVLFQDWVDTSGDSPQWKIWSGSAWVSVGTIFGELSFSETITSTSGAGAIITHAPVDVAADADKAAFAWGYAPFSWTNGPAGQVNYTDFVWNIGINVTPLGRINTAHSAVGFQFENKFYNGACFGNEVHLFGFTIAGAQPRYWTWFLPHNGEAGQTGHLKTLDYNDIFRMDGTAFSRDDTLNNRVDYFGGALLAFNQNNAPMIRCINAAGTASINFLSLNPDSVWSIDARFGLYIVGQAGASPLGVSAFLTDFCTSGLGVNGIYHVRNMGAVAGDAYRELCTGSFAGMMTTQWVNSSAAAGAGKVHRLTGAGGGDVFHIVENASQAYAFGIDTSDGNQFKVSGSTALGTTDFFIVNPATGLAGGSAGPYSQASLVDNTGSTNNSASGSGAFINMTPNKALAASHLTNKKALEVFATFQYVTGSVVPDFHIQLLLGATVLGNWDLPALTTSQTGHSVTYHFVLQATGAPGAAVGIVASAIGGLNQANGVAASNTIAQPVAVATNTALTLQLATKWGSAGTGTNTAQLLALVVREVN